jgi:hypothetical protein
METDKSPRTAAMERLSPFIGEWTVEVGFAPGMSVPTVFEWILGGQFLAQRTDIPDANAPDSMMVIGAGEDGAGYTQHHFDSRGVARLYAMTFDGRVWTLRREAPDFTPLGFHQRFTGTFSDDGRTIEGAAEISHDEGATWELDFEITYRKAGR